MGVVTKFPTTYEELAELGGELMTFPASWEEFLYLLEAAEYRVEYNENTITTMGYASLNHEELVLRLGQLFANLFSDEPNYRFFSSGRPVQIDTEKVYMPDLQIAKAAPKLIEYKKELNAHTNPWLIVEVLSPSTEGYDWSTKLPNYKQIPSVEYILYVQQNKPLISVFKRGKQQDVWENIDLNRLEQSFEIASKKLLLKDIYKNIL